MKFELKEFHRNISDEDIFADLRAVYEVCQQRDLKMTFRLYSQLGKYSSATIATRFGTWNKALEVAGLCLNEEKFVANHKLFANLEEVWILKGSQPVYREMNEPPSMYSASLYSARFGSWRNALRAFVKFINEEEHEGDSQVDAKAVQDNDTALGVFDVKHKTNRNISERMRFRVLLRDGFTCQSCGSSPLKSREVELHVDHIIPWSKGGETTEDNLQTKCSRCNLGKGNAFDA